MVVVVLLDRVDKKDTKKQALVATVTRYRARYNRLDLFVAM